jgi:hypothetical protein
MKLTTGSSNNSKNVSKMCVILSPILIVNILINNHKKTLDKFFLSDSGLLFVVAVVVVVVAYMDGGRVMRENGRSKNKTIRRCV